MIDLDVVTLSRLQFASTAMFHFLFVPLTLGLSFLLAIMESVYVMTGKAIWRRMTKFWGVLFGINFALGVATGIVMEFQFGMNWAYYSHYVGDIFGAPLAIEGLMAFFLEATFVGLFFFGWDRLKKWQHLMVTMLMALGSNLSALWILIANGWMQRAHHLLEGLDPAPEHAVHRNVTMIPRRGATVVIASRKVDACQRLADEIVAEWDELTPALVSRIRGEAEWPDGVTSFAERVIVLMFSFSNRTRS